MGNASRNTVSSQCTISSSAKSHVCTVCCTCNEMRSMLRMFSAAFRRRASAAASFAMSRLPLPELPAVCSPLLKADICASQLRGLDATALQKAHHSEPWPCSQRQVRAESTSAFLA